MPQAEHAHPAPVSAVALELTQRPVPIRTGVGSAHDPAATSSPKAQAFYDQGLAYLHSYVWIEAARSFNQALRIDPRIAMAYVGLSRALSGLYAYEAARAQIERARALASQASEHDRLHIT